MLNSVAVVLLPGVTPFELGVACEVFGVDRSGDGLPVFDFMVCTEHPGPVPTSAGFDLGIDRGLDAARGVDLVVLPAHGRAAASGAVLQLLRDTVAAGGTVLSVCTGAFTLGEAGLLDGRRATTHWMHTAELAAAYPQAVVDPSVLYVDAGEVVTSAGTAAGIDACLHIVRRELGASVARGIARRMVVPPHREGGQAQYLETPVAIRPSETLADVLAWMVAHLDRELSVDELAARAHMSPRTFARRFRAETGTTPMAWVTAQRLLLAQRLLEESDEPVERVAVTTGFGSAAVMRHHFARLRGTTPASYRRTFAARTSA